MNYQVIYVDYAVIYKFTKEWSTNKNDILKVLFCNVFVFLLFSIYCFVINLSFSYELNCY